MHEFLLFHNIIARPELRCCVDWGRSFFARGKTSSSSRLITATTEPVDSLNESSSDMEGRDASWLDLWLIASYGGFIIYSRQQFFMDDVGE